LIYLHCDGASKGNPGPSSIGVSATKENSTDEVFFISEKIGHSTNNIAEWTSLLKGIEKCIQMNEKEVKVFMDSELVVKQVKGLYKTKNENLIPLKKKLELLRKELGFFEINHVRREKNKRADELANLAFG
jgi:ribonuclease HI